MVPPKSRYWVHYKPILGTVGGGTYGSVEADFCISSAYVTSRMKQSFWSLNFPASGGLNKKHEKKHEFLVFKPLLQEI